MLGGEIHVSVRGSCVSSCKGELCFILLRGVPTFFFVYIGLVTMFTYIVLIFDIYIYIYIWWCMFSSPTFTCVVSFLSLYTCFFTVCNLLFLFHTKMPWWVLFKVFWKYMMMYVCFLQSIFDIYIYIYMMMYVSSPTFTCVVSFLSLYTYFFTVCNLLFLFHTKMPWWVLFKVFWKYRLSKSTCHKLSSYKIFQEFLLG